MQQIAVTQNGLHWRDPGRSAQHKEAVVARLLGQLAGIDLEGGAGVAAREPVTQPLRRHILYIVEMAWDGQHTMGVIINRQYKSWKGSKIF